MELNFQNYGSVMFFEISEVLYYYITGTQALYLLDWKCDKVT
jgi:hypothetical protein